MTGLILLFSGKLPYQHDLAASLSNWLNNLVSSNTTPSNPPTFRDPFTHKLTPAEVAEIKSSGAPSPTTLKPFRAP
ncbi:MAG TPA: hypothetical protein PKN13_15200 [Accumulibacter sp.]|nr:hypothetical protein [Accumulibacter sp.]